MARRYRSTSGTCWSHAVRYKQRIEIQRPEKLPRVLRYRSVGCGRELAQEECCEVNVFKGPTSADLAPHEQPETHLLYVGVRLASSPQKPWLSRSLSAPVKFMVSEMVDTNFAQLIFRDDGYQIIEEYVVNNPRRCDAAGAFHGA